MEFDGAPAGAALAAALEHLTNGSGTGWTRRAPGAMGMVTGVPVAALNGVWVHGREADPGAVGELLDEVSRAGVPYCLELPPQSEALGELAAARELRGPDEIPLMVCRAGDETEVTTQDELVIAELEPSQAVLHADLAAAGFGAPPEIFRRLMPPAVLAQPGVDAFIGRVAGEPVVTGFSVCLEGSVGILNVATLPDHRQRGFGGALTAHALGRAWACGARWAWLQPSPQGYGVYERLGFRVLETRSRWVMEASGPE